MKKIYFLFIGLFLSNSAAFAQDDVSDFIDDMLVIAGNFSEPAADGAAYQAAAGWFSSALPLEKWDFRLSVHGNALFVPSDKKSFELSNADLKLLEIKNADGATLPTAFGGYTPVEFTGNINFLGENIPVEFKGIDGIGRDYIPHAFLQVAVGLPAGTEVTVRAMPETTIDGVTASTFGIGAKHSLSQYFGYNDPESFQLAVGAAYSKLNVEYEYDPIVVDELLLMDMITVDADLFMAEVIGSKQWGFFELFAAAGAMNSNFKYTFGGSGPYLTNVNAAVDNLEDSIIQFKGDLGFNLHFGRLRLSTMATLGDFLNANVGLHVRI